MLRMVHDEIEMAGTAFDETAFRQVWQPRGWRRMDEATAFANDTLEKFVRSADGLTKDEARLLVSLRPSAEYPDEDATGPEIIAVLRASFEAEKAAPATTTETKTGLLLKLYDPSEHPVNASSDGSDEGVLAYLEKSDDDERQRVLELEEAGQGRPTILNWSPPETDPASPADDQNKE